MTQVVQRLAGMAATAAALCGGALPAADYPVRPVRLIVPYAPGAAQDLTGRLLAQKLSDAWGTQVLVDNRPGAGSSIGAELAARAPADGYTLLLGNEAMAINASLMKTLKFDAQKDFVHITVTVINPRVFVGNPAMAAESIREVIAMARAKPGSVRYGSSGIGTGPHLAGALLASMAQVEMTHVPYKGAAPAMTDVMAGQIEMVATTVMSSIPMIQAGKLKALAVTSAERSSALPHVPTVAEMGVAGFEASAWSMLLAPKGTPRQVVVKVQSDTVQFLALPDVRRRLLADGAEVVGSTPEAAALHMRKEIGRWAKVILEAGVKGDQ